MTGMRRLGAIPILAWTIAAASPAYAQDYLDPEAARLPDPSSAPLAQPQETDPILAIADAMADEAAFHQVITEAIRSSPSLAEGRADGAGTLAAREGARWAEFPRVDLAISGNKALARDFSNDPDNLIERLRGSGRVDATATMEQMLFDFGANRRRIESAIERIGAAEAEYDRKSEAVALRAVAAWYDLFAFGHLTELAENFIAQNEELRSAVESRIAQGIAAPVERARIDSAIATAKLRLAQFRRELANARARFAELFSLQAPSRIARAPAPNLIAISDEDLTARAGESAPVLFSEALAKSARAEARAARADTMPSLTVGIDAGRYGLLEEGRNDYEVRGRLTLRYRLSGQIYARANEARARAEAAEARALTAKLEAEREARIAWADVGQLDATLVAYREDYLANRITRDAVVERFRVARGTLFDALDSEDRLFVAAANYIRAMAERDAAAFVAVARAGDLLRLLNVAPATEETFR